MGTVGYPVPGVGKQGRLAGAGSGYPQPLVGTAQQQTDEPPLAGYALLVSAYLGAVIAFFAWLRDSGRDLPERPEAGDLLLLGIGTHKASRLIAKDKVGSAVRAPFAEVEGRAGPGEVESRPRGEGLRRAIGDLVICPRCVGQWVGTAFAMALVAVPRTARFVAGVLTVATISDLLQIVRRSLERGAES
jgi:hypothetical protein